LNSPPISSQDATVANGGTAQVAAPGAAVNILTIDGGSTVQMSPIVNAAPNVIDLVVSNSVKIGTGGTIRFTGGISNSGTDMGGRISAVPIQDNGNILFDGPFNHALPAATIVTGTGSLTMAGTGTLTISAPNTYSGATKILSGTLLAGSTTGLSPNSAFTVNATATLDLDRFSNTIGSLAGNGIVTNNGNALAILTVGADNTNTTFSGILQNGTSILGLTKVGTGTLALSGVNTYTGGTTISAGTLQMLPGGRLALGNVTIGPQGTLRFSGGFVAAANFRNNGIMLFDGPLDHFVNVPVVGTGKLTMAGTGTLNLSSNNTYTGATTVSAGILQAGSATALSTNSAFTVNSQLDLNGFSNTIGSLGGNGIVTNNGNRLAILTIGTDNTNTTFSGTLEDSNSRLGVTKVGAGTLTLTGTNTYTGGTMVSAGTLQLGNGGMTGSIAGDVVDNGTLAFNRSDSVTFNGVISGAGNVIKLSTGTLTLPGTNTYTGTTTVNSGSLIVDGSIASGQTVVNSGAFLGGHGIIGGNLVNSGVVSQINSPGTLTVGGNYTQNAGGTLRIGVAGVAPAQHDLLAVNGHATLGGTLQLISLGGFNFQPGEQITLLTAKNGVSGTFSNTQNGLVSTGTIVQGQITSLANAVVLETTQGSFANTPGVAHTGNQKAVAKTLDSAVGDPREAALFAFLNSQRLANLPHDLTLIAPAQITSINATAVSVGKVQVSNVGQRLANIRGGSTGFSPAGFSLTGGAASFDEGFAGVSGPEGKSGPAVFAPTPDNRWGVFITGLGEFSNVDSTPNAAGYDVNTGGFTFGVDYRLTPNFAIGLTGGYAHTSVGLDGGGNIDVNGGKLGLYATAFANGFYLDTAVSGGPSGYNTRRTALQGTANGNTDGADFNALIAVGYDWTRGNLSIGPTASFQYSYIGLNSFTEIGSLAPLNFPDQNTESERSAFGAKASYQWKVAKVTAIPQVSAAWQHEYGATAYSIASSFASGAGQGFTVTGPDIGRDSLLVGAGVTVILNERVSTYLYYDGEFARTNYLSNNVSGGVRINF
jgi:autotransporter-associated beta strand protein